MTNYSKMKVQQSNLYKAFYQEYLKPFPFRNYLLEQPDRVAEKNFSFVKITL